MTLVSAVAYHGLAVIALLIHFLAFGLYVLITMALTAPPDMELPAVIVKLIIVAGWVVLLGFGLSEWRGHRWGVVAVPLLAVAFFWIVGSIGRAWIGWYIDMGGP